MKILVAVLLVEWPHATASFFHYGGERASPLRTPSVRACAGSGPSPEAWREFRANLIAGGIKVTSGEDGGDVEVETSEAAVPAAPREAVAPANEKLLKSQNAALYDEYLEGQWAQ